MNNDHQILNVLNSTKTTLVLNKNFKLREIKSENQRVKKVTLFDSSNNIEFNIFLPVRYLKIKLSDSSNITGINFIYYGLKTFNVGEIVYDIKLEKMLAE